MAAVLDATRGDGDAVDDGSRGRCARDRGTRRAPSRCHARPFPEQQRLFQPTGVVVNQQQDREKRDAYRSDITYSQNKEFGFDYLRDNMKFSALDYALSAASSPSSTKRRFVR